MILFWALLPSRFTLAPRSPSFHLKGSLSRGTFSSPNPRFFSRSPHLSPRENSHLTKPPSGQRVPQLLASLASQTPPPSLGTPSLSNPVSISPRGPSISSLPHGARSIPLGLPLLCSLAPPRVARAQPHPAAPPQNAGAARGSAAERGRVPSV